VREQGERLRVLIRRRIDMSHYHDSRPIRRYKLNLPGATVAPGTRGNPGLAGRLPITRASMNRLTPAMEAGVADHVWSLEEMANWPPCSLQHRDRGCRLPGCGVGIGEGHHIRHWARGGPTTLANLTILCRWHHRAVHEEGYQVAREPDGALQFRRPDGRPLPEVPRPTLVGGDALTELRARHDAEGLTLTARTSCPSWLGERLDLGWAIDVLHPRARGPKPP
jgi:HNH endonuclease